MPEINTAVIKRMLYEGRANDLLELMEGESKYSRLEILENLPGKNCTREQKMEELYITGLAVDHVRFVAKYGLSVETAIDGEKIYSARPEAFEKWLQLGCLRLNGYEIEAYLNANPFG
jgi:hypothetical protein